MALGLLLPVRPKGGDDGDAQGQAPGGQEGDAVPVRLYGAVTGDPGLPHLLNVRTLQGPGKAGGLPQTADHLLLGRLPATRHFPRE